MWVKPAVYPGPDQAWAGTVSARDPQCPDDTEARREPFEGELLASQSLSQGQKNRWEGTPQTQFIQSAPPWSQSLISKEHRNLSTFVLNFKILLYCLDSLNFHIL